MAPEKKTATAGVAVKLVEAAGQPVRPFRDGLDYAFILVLRMRSVLSGRKSAGSLCAPGPTLRRVYESLQDRPEVGPLPIPRRCHARLLPATGFADVSPVFTLSSRTKATN